MRLLLVLLLLAALPVLADDARKGELDRLFAALKAAPGEAAAAALETKIRQVWQQASSPAVLLLIGQARTELGQGDAAAALAALDDALVLAPDDPEAWLARAVARLQAGDAAGAIRDLHAALQREPRQFVALQALSRIAEAQQDWKAALAAWQKALELDPRMPEGQARLLLLRRRAGEEPT